MTLNNSILGFNASFSPHYENWRPYDPLHPKFGQNIFGHQADYLRIIFSSLRPLVWILQAFK